jgi:hypothetical protein
VIVDLIGSLIRTVLEQKDSKDVTITLAKAVAAKNNRGSITNAQKVGRKVKVGPKAKVGPKPRAKLAKPCTKAGSKRKRVEIEADDDEPTSPRRLRKRA